MVYVFFFVFHNKHLMNYQNKRITFPRVKGLLFWVHLISVSGTDPSTLHINVYSISEVNCFGFSKMLVDVGFTNHLERINEMKKMDN